MATGNTADLMQQLVGAVEKEVNKQSQEIVERHKKQIAEELEVVIRDTVGKMGLRIAKYSQIHMAQDRITIEISDRRAE